MQADTASHDSGNGDQCLGKEFGDMSCIRQDKINVLRRKDLPQNARIGFLPILLFGAVLICFHKRHLPETMKSASTFTVPA